MLPDFPKLKEKLQKFWNKYAEYRMEQFLRESIGFMRESSQYHHHEGKRWSVKMDDGQENVSEYKESNAGMYVHSSEVPTLTPDKIKQKIDQLAYEMATQVEEYTFKSLMQGLEENNRVHKSSESEVAVDHILQALQELLIEFDSDGNAIMPSMLVSPEIGEKLKDKLPLWEDDPEITRRFDEIMEKKREEWRARESRRKLVD